MTTFQVGDELIVQRTDHVLRRCPRKVGRVGIVQTVPIVQSGNYVLHDRETGDPIRLPASCLRYYEGRKTPQEESAASSAESVPLPPAEYVMMSPATENGIENDVATNATVKDERKRGRPARRSTASAVQTLQQLTQRSAKSEENDEFEVPRAKTESPLRDENDPDNDLDNDAEREPVDLKVGMRVKIIATPNVWQRVPQLVDKIGIIKEAPVHPATWFKVQFPFQEKFVTFRPTALQPVDADDLPLEGYVMKSSVSKHAHARTSLGEPLLRDSTFRTSTAKRVAQTLSAVDPETWVGRKVLIRAGKVAGVPATVLSVGSGWVTCDTLDGTVARRAYELELLEHDEQLDAELLDAESEFENVDKAVLTSRGRRERAGSTSSVGKYDSGGEREREREHTRRRVRSERMQLAAESKEVQARPSRGERDRDRETEEPSGPSHKREREREPATTSSSSQGRRGVSQSATMSARDNALYSSSTAGGGIINTHMALLRRKQVAHFLQEQRAKTINRPMLRDWEFRLNDLLGNTALQERQAARRFDDSWCETCCVEKLPSAMFCWNEGCPASPVWYRLTGESAPAVARESKESEKSERVKTNATQQEEEKEKESEVCERETSFAAPVSWSGVQSNVTTSFLLDSPAVLLQAGQDDKRSATRLSVEEETPVQSADNHLVFSSSSHSSSSSHGVKANEGVFAGLVPLRPLPLPLPAASTGTAAAALSLPGPLSTAAAGSLALSQSSVAAMPALTFTPAGSLSSSLPPALPRAVFKMPDTLGDAPAAAAAENDCVHSAVRLAMPSKDVLMLESAAAMAAMTSKPRKKKPRLSAPVIATTTVAAANATALSVSDVPLSVSNGFVGF